MGIRHCVEWHSGLACNATRKKRFACTQSQREGTKSEQRVSGMKSSVSSALTTASHFNIVSVVGACSRHTRDSTQSHDTAMNPAFTAHCVCALLTCVRRSQQQDSLWPFPPPSFVLFAVLSIFHPFFHRVFSLRHSHRRRRASYQE